MKKKPYMIEFPKIGDPSIGYISVAEFEKLLPFRPERVYWTYYTPESIVRGRHAHHNTEQVLIAVSGTILVHIETIEGELYSYKLEKPSQGIYIPPMAWHTMQYSHTAVQLIIASSKYDEADYIRSYDAFCSLKNNI